MRVRQKTTAAFLITIALAAVSNAAESVISYAAHSLLFEVPNGAVPGQFVAADIDAIGAQHGRKWAEVRLAVFDLLPDSKAITIEQFRCSTDDETIEDLRISASAIAFDMRPYPARLFHVIVKRRGSSYQATVSGEWTDAVTKRTTKVEWRQVRQIALPYPIFSISGN